MAARDKLFQLIQSMTKNEKRYFTIDANKINGEKGNKYLAFFELIKKMVEYDEEKLKKKYKELNIKTPFAQAKAALYEEVLESLRNYQKKDCPYAKVDEKILDARYLLNRRSFDQSVKAINKAKKWAYEYEFFERILSIIELEYRLIALQRDSKSKEKQEQLKIEWEKVKEMNQLKFHFLYQSEKNTITLNERYSLNRNEILEPLKTQYNEEMIVIEKDPYRSFSSEFYRLNSLFTYFQFIKDHKSAAQCYEALFKLKDTSKKMGKLFMPLFSVLISNFMGSCFRGRAFDQMEIVLGQAKQLQFEHEKDRIKAQTYIYYYELLYYMNICEFKKATSVAKTIEKFIEADEVTTKSTLLSLMNNLFILYFVIADYKRSLHWVEKIIEIDEQKIRTDITYIARWFELILLYELKKEKLLSSRLRATNRYLKKKGKKYELEALVISYLNKLINAPVNERISIYRIIENELKKLQLDEEGKNALGLEEMTLWIEHKITKQDMTEIMCKKFKKYKK